MILQIALGIVLAVVIIYAVPILIALILVALAWIYEKLTNIWKSVKNEWWFWLIVVVIVVGSLK